MANVKNAELENEVVSTEPVELNLEQKITIRSIAEWDTGFRRVDGTGDIQLAPNGTYRISRGEVIAQCQNGNRLLTGVDGQGSHATIIIEDEPTRREVNFDIPEEGIKQNILTEQSVKDLFDTKSIKTFEAKLHEMVVTRAEKHAIISYIRKLKLNDYEKNRIVEHWTNLNAM